MRNATGQGLRDFTIGCTIKHLPCVKSMCDFWVWMITQQIYLLQISWLITEDHSNTCKIKSFQKLEPQSACPLPQPQPGPSIQWCLMNTWRNKELPFFRGCYRWSVSPQIKVEILTPKGDGISRWGCWEIIRSRAWSPQEWEKRSYKGNSTLLLSPCHCVRT